MAGEHYLEYRLSSKEEVEMVNTWYTKKQQEEKEKEERKKEEQKRQRDEDI